MIENESHHGIRLQAVLDTAVDGIILIDAKGDVLTVNPACQRLFGYQADEVIGRNVKMLMPPVYSENHDDYLATRGIRIVPSLPEELVIQVDPTRIERAISCLLSNAIKFSSDGGEIDVRAELGTDDEIRIAISDNGIGIAPSAIERAFTPFVQLADKLSRPYEGAGLGLPLARRLAEMHGGTVVIRSRPGQGTVATLRLPAYSRPFDDMPAIRKPDRSKG